MADLLDRWPAFGMPCEEVVTIQFWRKTRLDRTGVFLFGETEQSCENCVRGCV